MKGNTWQSYFGTGNYKKQIDGKYYPKGKPGTIKFIKRFIDLKVLILDEISLLGLEDLLEIHERLVEIFCLLYVENTTGNDYDENEINNIKEKPFGGVHMIFSGDFYQLVAICREAIFSPIPKSDRAKLGKAFWLKVFLYFELTENPRFDNIKEYYTTSKDEPINVNSSITSSLEESALNRIAKNARVGKLTKTEVDELNNECLVNNIERHIDLNFQNNKTIWLATTKKEVSSINKKILKKMIEKNPNLTCFSIVAVHKRTNIKIAPNSQNSILNANLYKISKQKSPIILNLAIGTRVKLTENLATEIGLYNGALGTVVGFCFENKLPNVKIVKNILSPENNGREMPIVLVQFDVPTGFSVSSLKSNVIPISAIPKMIAEGYNRFQLPLVVAHALTIHSQQGQTAIDDVVLYPTKQGRRPFTDGLEYVGISRVRSLEKLKLASILELNHFNHKSYKTHKKNIENEYIRLNNLMIDF